MKRQITITLDPKSIDKAIKELEQYKAEIKAKTEMLVSKLVDKGVDIAKMSLLSYGAYQTGDLFNSIDGEVAESKTGKLIGYVRVCADYVVYVEFGTGVVGDKSPHPDAQDLDYDYDVNDHGEDGWFYPYDNRRAHKYRFNPATKREQPWTAGEPAKPFMYDTSLYLRDILISTAKEVFG